MLELIARTNAAVGQEIFLLQMNDIGEVVEQRPATAISSSAMRHKINPSRSEALMHYGRNIPALASILSDDVVNFFERDKTSRPNGALEDISIEAGQMVGDVQTLLRRIGVNPARMRANFDSTDGMVMAQRIVLELQNELGK